ncbi:MAG: chromosome segregation protein SMC, partial [Nitrospiraceae bacterium]
MHLKSLELTGFKSFTEAKIEFPPGITTVVGPNGTGKSNVVDAMLWVLGEQSTKTLRSERMEDVIFNGTEARKPLGMVEVSLVVSGLVSEQLATIPSLPPQLSECYEVMITRRLYRNGESEYLINKALCRLKDIRSLFLDTRAGSKGHTVIEQGRIEQILNASPQDRRELIEETAGIVRYKKQKAEALRKLESTNQNLLRVRDIISEVRQRLNGLERQERQARSYKKLQDQARGIEIRLLVRDYRELLAGQAQVDSQSAALDAEESARTADEARLTCELEDVKLRLRTGEEALNVLREQLALVERQQTQALTISEVERNRLGILEQQRSQALQELTRLGSEEQRVDAEMAELRLLSSQAQEALSERTRGLTELEEGEQALARRRAGSVERVEQSRRTVLDVTVQATSGENVITQLAQQLEDIRRRLTRLAGERAAVEAERAAVHERLQEFTRTREDVEGYLRERQREREAAKQSTQQLEAQLRQAEQQVNRQQEELASAESRVRALQGIVREEMGYGRAGQEDSTSLRAACAGVREAVAEWLEVPPQFERAIEAVLGERARAWLVEAPDHAKEAVTFLKEKKLGRGAFVPTQLRQSPETLVQESASWWSTVTSDRGVLGKALDLVSAPSKSRDALVLLLNGVIIVDTLDTAIRLWRQGEWPATQGPTFVTVDGEVLDGSGVLTGGTTGGPIQRRREIQELDGKWATLSAAVDECRQDCERLGRELQSARAEEQRLDAEVRETELRQLALAKDEASFKDSLDGLDRRIETFRAEGAADEEERTRLESEIRSSRERLTQMEQDRDAQDKRLGELNREVQGMEDESITLQQELTESRLAMEALRARREHLEADLSRLSKEQDERGVREDELNQQINALLVSTQQSQAERERNEKLIQEFDLRAGEVRRKLVAAQEVQSQDMLASRQLDDDLAGARDRLARSRQARTGLEVRRAEIKTKLSTLEESLVGTYQLSVSDALAQERDWQDEETAQGGPGTESVDAREASPTLREELQKIRDRLQRMGPINLAAIDEYQEQEERHRFLVAQEEDLVKSVQSLKEIISKINRTTKRMFMETFTELQQKFSEVFSQFFTGGRAELILTDPRESEEGGPSGSDEPGVEIVAQPPGKRLKSISMLSGGEKTLTAMALLFASFLIRPTPFCILDEIDAPLDEENIGRFVDVLQQLAERAQFIVVTHNKRTMGVADSLFGVTMEEPGVSKLVSV